MSSGRDAPLESKRTPEAQDDKRRARVPAVAPRTASLRPFLDEDAVLEECACSLASACSKDAERPFGEPKESRRREKNPKIVTWASSHVDPRVE